jgi:seryl-tRNA synthetase
LPNLLDDSVPDGADESANLECAAGASRARSTSRRKITSISGCWISRRRRSISGARFVVMRGALARLHRALIQFMLDLHTREHGYTEIYAPYIVNGASLVGTGQLPKFRADLFALEGRAGLLPDSDRRGAGHQPGARRDPPAESLPLRDRPHAVLPLRGRLLRQGHARHDPPAPVREGRAGADRATRTSPWRRSRS